MMRSRHIAVAMIGALALAGCEGDAGAGAADAATCTVAPDAGAQSGAYIVVSFGFVRPDTMRMGAVDGFDIDGRVSASGDQESCRQADFVSPEGVPGVDNQLARLIPIVDSMTGGALDPAIQEAVNNGQLLLAIALEGLDDRRNDDCVALSFQRVNGMAYVGGDRRIDPGQTFDRVRDVLPSRVMARVRNGVLEAGPFTLAVPIAILDARFTLNLYRARVRGRLEEDGSIRGVFGGGISLVEFHATIRTLTVSQGQMATFINATSLFADLDVGEDGRCRQLSAALNFTARPAFVNP